jgi:hypothetical protein
VGVGVSTGETISGITVLIGSELAGAVGTRVCSRAITRLGVLVGVGVTWLAAPGPQAKMGAIKIINAPGKRIKNRFMGKQITSLLESGPDYSIRWASSSKAGNWSK